jgi:acetate kinase
MVGTQAHAERAPFPLTELFQVMQESTRLLGDAFAFHPEVTAVGHRVVHGGSKFSSSVVITPQVIAEIEPCRCSPRCTTR